MRGLASIIWGKEQSRISEVLVICSADEDCFPAILSEVQKHFADARISYVVCNEYLRLLPTDANLYLITDIRKSFLRKLREIRSIKYDVAVLMLTGKHVFPKIKLWALFTNYQMLYFYDETLARFLCCGKNSTELLSKILIDLRIPPFPSGLLSIFLSPLGLLRLLFFTAHMKLRAKWSRQPTADSRHE
jgi:hypothetical protein